MYHNDLKKLSFSDLLDFENYKTIKIDFLIFSNVELKGLIEQDLISDKLVFDSHEISFSKFLDLEIEGNNPDENLVNLEKEYVSRYLKPAIKNLYNNYIIKIEIRRVEEKKYSVEEKIGYYDEIESNFIFQLERINECRHFSLEIKEELINIVNELRDFVFDKKAELIEIKNEKIPFNLSREQIAIIFALMYKNNIINNSLRQPQLAKIIEDTFCHNKTENISHMRNLIYKYSKPNSLSEKQKTNIKQLIFDMLS